MNFNDLELQIMYLTVAPHRLDQIETIAHINHFVMIL
jgi:hypothetical protein